MSIRNLQRSKKLKKLKLSRQQISERALEIAKQMIDHGGYKNAVAGIGRMKILAQAVNDGYWEEKRSMGEEYEEYYLLHGDQNVKSRAVE
jgi:hypothetical protein